MSRSDFLNLCPFRDAQPLSRRSVNIAQNKKIPKYDIMLCSIYLTNLRVNYVPSIALSKVKSVHKAEHNWRFGHPKYIDFFQLEDRCAQRLK
ncbi:hypothetical protein BIW11_10352 [Tropilaelaps mercedesae]|uniref:Uncharacterized protein n=1 Tax=Tropilaelaps mercedesae TaxID=418985 RepID=A0A1V9XG25_9ACAR|nr:hypothetical protein BIW11_10352 [Tropilaelaps mercedesae]